MYRSISFDTINAVSTDQELQGYLTGFALVPFIDVNRPFKSSLAFECKRGWSRPCFDTGLSAFSFKCLLEQEQEQELDLHKKSSEVCIKTM